MAAKFPRHDHGQRAEPELRRVEKIADVTGGPSMHFGHARNAGTMNLYKSFQTRGVVQPGSDKEDEMKTVTAILAAALIAGGSSLALAQSEGGGAGGDVASPRKNQARPNGPTVNKRDDDMAPLNAPTNTAPTNTRPSSGSFYRRAPASQNSGGNNGGNGNNSRN
jgi:hypothetical protein